MTIHHPLDADAGAPGTTLDLAAAYEEQGHRVTVISHDDLSARISAKGREALFPLLLPAAIGRRVVREPVDVIDASTGDAWLWARFARLAPRRRPLLVTRSHGLEHAAHAQRLQAAAAGALELSWKYPLYWGGLRLWEVGSSLRVADLCLLLNDADRSYAVRNLGVEPQRAHVAHNGIADEFLGQAAAIDDAPCRRPRIAHVGSFIQRKGVGYAAAAIAAFLTRQPDASATFLGTQAAERVVLDAFPESVRGRITVIPRYRRADLPRLLEGHQITVSSSLSEGFGKAVLEAMSCGLAPIATDTPGPTEFIEGGVNGIVVEPRDPAAIERALQRLASDGALLGRIRRAAHATAQQYGWDRLAAQRIELYERAIDERATITATSSRIACRSASAADRPRPGAGPPASDAPRARS
jgi:glycosyltransferase involved in cell wall biosynthesis